MSTLATTDRFLVDIELGTQNATAEQASIVGRLKRAKRASVVERLKHLLSTSYAVIKKALASEFAKYLALQMIIFGSALAYHCIGLWWFYPENTKIVVNTATPTTFCFVDVDYWSPMILYIAIGYGTILVQPIVLFFLAVLDVASEYTPDHYKVSHIYSKRKRVFWGAMGLLLLVTYAVAPELFFLIGCAIISYGIVKLVSFITSKVSTTRLIIFGNCLVAAVALLRAYFTPYLLGGTPITEYFQRNRMDISQYEKFFAEFDVDISRVFVVGGMYSDNAASNTVPFKSIMSIMIGKDTIQNNSFEAVKALLLHEIGHARHFDLLSIFVAPYIIASLAMCFLVKRI
ncbi:uncharacterized protein VICG_01813, partial [Vittaforma corneae ATCC 50505]